jgi:hypothetical protein
MNKCDCSHALGLRLAISEVGYCVGPCTPALNGRVAALERDLNRGGGGGGGVDRNENNLRKHYETDAGTRQATNTHRAQPALV